MPDEEDEAAPLLNAVADIFFAIKLNMFIDCFLTHGGKLDAAQQVCAKGRKGVMCQGVYFPLGFLFTKGMSDVALCELAIMTQQVIGNPAAEFACREHAA